MIWAEDIEKALDEVGYTYELVDNSQFIVSPRAYLYLKKKFGESLPVADQDEFDIWARSIHERSKEPKNKHMRDYLDRRHRAGRYRR